MKHLNLKVIASCLTFALFITSAVTTSAQKTSELQVCMKNLIQTSPSEIQFELWISDNTQNGDTYQFQSIQAGIDFDYAAISNGGTLTTSMVKSNPSLPTTQKTQIPNWGGTTKNLQPSTGHWRIAALVNLDKATAPIINANGFWYATYKITNSVPFTANSNPNFVFNLSSARAKTRTAVTAFVNSESLSKPFASELTTGNVLLTCTPSIVLNAKPSATIDIQKSTEVKLYPNPVTDHLQILFTSVESANTIIRISDMNGRLLKEIQTQAFEGSNNLRIEMDDYAAGTYQVQIAQNDNVIFKEKFIKQ